MERSDDTVDARIERFMARKMEQFPELEKKHARKQRAQQRGRFLNDLIELINYKRVGFGVIK
jgi:hypothetical protein